MVIDARNKLKAEDITHFLESASNEIELFIDDKDTAMMTKSSLVKDLLSISVEDRVEIVCVSESSELQITGLDINWWKDNARRYNKLYKAAEEVLSQVPASTYRIGIATLIEGHLTQIKKIEGTKNDILNALNDDIRTRYIDSFLKAQVVVNLAYQDGDEEDIEPWLTLEELRDIGAIKLRS